MFKLICKLFIPNYEDTTNQKVREKYGVVFSIFSIVCNTLMVGFKLFVSFITGSISIRADAFNNLSDIGSNLATLFGFKLSSKHPDADHPYGHGRMEYISAMVVSFLILFMGIDSLKNSIVGIFKPTELQYSTIGVIILVVSILTKLLMCILNKKAGKAIDSEAMKAASQDSFNDSLMTLATLICLLVYKFFNVNIDAYVGVVVSLFVIKSGIDIFRGVFDMLMGKTPDKELVKEIERYVLDSGNGKILGIHDLMMHDYGPANKYMNFHAEVDAADDIIEIHDIIDNIEIGILDKYGILTTIHMDPVEKNDSLTATIREQVKEAVKKINDKYDIHDFRIVTGPTHTNLVFDLVVNREDEDDHEEIRKRVVNEISKIDNTYRCVIKVEHPFY